MRSAASVAIALFLASVLLAAQGAAASPGSWRSRSSAEANLAYTDADTEAEVVVGREVAAHLLSKHLLSQDRKLQRYVNLVGAVLAQNSSRPDLQFRFAVVDSAEINAYSTPGGYIFVTSAALAAMENEAELAGVLAHEISHVAERHIVKEINLRGVEKSAAMSIANLIGGSGESAAIAFSHSVEVAVDIILRDGYRKQDEIQADSEAVVLCAFAGYDPAALGSFLTRVSKTKSKVGKTYPAYDERLAVLERVIRENVGEGQQGLALNRDRLASVVKRPSGPASLLKLLH